MRKEFHGISVGLIRLSDETEACRTNTYSAPPPALPPPGGTDCLVEKYVDDYQYEYRHAQQPRKHILAHRWLLFFLVLAVPERNLHAIGAPWNFLHFKRRRFTGTCARECQQTIEPARQLPLARGLRLSG